MKFTTWKNIGRFFVKEKNNNYLIVDPEQPNWCLTNLTGLLMILFWREDLHSNEAINYYSQLRQIDWDLSSSELYQLKKKLDAINFLTSNTNEIIKDTKCSIIYLNITNRCNMICSYCYISAGEFIEEMPSNEIQRIVNDIRDINERATIVLSGGEPLIRKDFLDIVKIIKNAGFKIFLITNGSLITDKLVDALKKIGINQVQVSLDGSSKEIHEKTRAIGSYSKIIKGIELLIKNGIYTVISPTMTKFNYKNLLELHLLTEKIGAKFGPNLFVPAGRGKSHVNLSADITDIYSFLKQWGEQSQQIKEPICSEVSGTRYLYIPRVRAKICGIGKELLSIAPDGTVYPCHLMHIPEFSMGNCRTTHLREIIESKSKNVRIEVENIKECSNCQFRYICGGGCRASAYWEYGSLFRKDPRCHLRFRLIEDELFNSLICT